MKVTHVSLMPAEAAAEACRPSLTPELLAASGARYSRNNEGLEAILSKIDPANLDRSVDSIFRMIDYGHMSISDMAPVAMFMDGLSVWLVYYVWTLCPTAGGQESSTRYIRISHDSVPEAGELGVGPPASDEWRERNLRLFDAYGRALELWEAVAAREPSVVRIPRSLLEDTSEKSRRAVERMRRNYAFDRARYFLPLSALTNMMLVMNARGWVQLAQHLLSHPLPEANRLGELIRQELSLVTPRLLRHAAAQPSTRGGIRDEFMQLNARAAREEAPHLLPEAETFVHPVGAYLDALEPPDASPAAYASDLSFHDNRYAWIGPDLRRVAVRFGWQAVSIAEARDLNRHRTGNKHCPLLPRGFYCAEDQLPPRREGDPDHTAALRELAREGRRASAHALELLRRSEPSYVYHVTLGTQVPFEHLTTGDKFVYEAELRTGTGAHFRYADHLRDVLKLWYTRFPTTRGMILEGSNEPE